MKKMVFLFLSIVLIGVMAACGNSQTQGNPTPAPAANTPAGENQPEPTENKAAEFVFKLGHLQNGEHPYHMGAEKFKQLVEEKSDGRIVINIFPSSQLGNGRDQIEGLQLGTIQLHIGSVAPVANFAPKMNVLSLPYLFRDREHAFAVLDGEIGAALSADLEAVGIKNLAFWENGWRHFTNDVRPIKTAADASGLKLRVQESAAYISYINALGSTPTPIPFGELYTAMEQKVVDGQENPLAQIATNKFSEVQKYLTLNGHTYDAAVFLMSKAAYDNLPPDLQAVIDEATEAATTFERQIAQELESKFLQQLIDEGMQVEENPDVESFRKAVEPVYKEFEAELGKDLIDQIINIK